MWTELIASPRTTSEKLTPTSHHSAIEEYKSSGALDDGADAKTEPRSQIQLTMGVNKS
jgi:hypothetical protein